MSPSRFAAWRTRFAAFTCSLTVFLSAALSQAAEPAAASLGLVPQDAAYYSAMLRVGEQIDIVKKSNWWKRVNEWDLIQQAKFMAQLGLQQGPGQQVTIWLQQPENQQLMEVVEEMFSEEVFCYGDKQTTGTMALALDSMNSMRYGPMLYEVLGQDSELTQDEFMAKMVLDSLAGDVENVAVPTMVLGMRIKNTEPAEEQLRRLEALVQAMLQQLPPDAPPLQDKFKREKVGNDEFLTLTLDGSMVPWDEIPFEDLEDEAGQYDKLKKTLQGLRFVISIGIHDKYAIISIGPSNDHLTRLGKGEVLADHAKLAPLRAKATLPITGITYASEQFMQAVATKPEDLDELVDVAKQLMPLAELPAEDEAAILADIQDLAKDIKPFIPKLGAQLGFSYLTDRGYEGYSYNWSESMQLDGSKPLTLLNHLGGSPVFAFLARGQHRPQDYELLAKWLKKGHGYFEKYAVPEMSDRERTQYEQVAAIATPLLARMHEVNQKMLIPSLADAQGGFVIDAKVRTKEWTKQLPPTAEPLALPSPAMIMGLKDPELFKKALGEYRSIVNEVLKEAHKVNPDEVPDVQLPPAKVRELKSGGIAYYYPLPEEFGIYELVAPNVVVTDTFAAMSLLPQQTTQMATSKPLAVDGGPLANTDRPLAAAVYFDWVALVDMAKPWVDEGVRAYVRSMEQAFGDLQLEGALNAEGDSDMAKQILDQVNKGAELLKAFRGYSSVTYIEDGAVITHAESRFQDIK